MLSKKAKDVLGQPNLQYRQTSCGHTTKSCASVQKLEILSTNPGNQGGYRAYMEESMFQKCSYKIYGQVALPLGCLTNPASVSEL